jgi:hypothetical protein
VATLGVAFAAGVYGNGIDEEEARSPWCDECAWHLVLG